MEFSNNTINFLAKEFPGVTKNSIKDLDLHELKQLRDKVLEKRQEYLLIELAYKLCANAAYGSSGNEHFYWYRPELASAITGEARQMTFLQWRNFPKFMKEDIWNRKDLWEKFDFELDENKRHIIDDACINAQSDTDSAYVSWQPLFDCMTGESQKKYDTDEKKLNFILDFYKGFLNDEQNNWCYDALKVRHGNSVHEFELELVCKSMIGLAKKKYVKSVVFEKGHFMIDNPKLKSTGVEIVKSTTPAICRKFLKDITNDLLYNYDENHKEEFIFMLNDKLARYYKEFKAAPIDDISQSVGVGDYKKYVVEDKESVVLNNHCPFSVKAAALYNHLAYKAGRSDLKIMSGKIKYYNIRVGKKNEYFGFPYGECPDFAPPVDYNAQWQKNLIDPINRFLVAMNIPQISACNCIQMDLFGF
jgi:DNA polymerase elongation subunit (family B)